MSRAVGLHTLQAMDGVEWKDLRRDRSRILIIDDERAARDATLAMLAQDPYELHVAASAEAAMGLLDSVAVDLLICDVMMPGTDGLAVCRAMKAHPAWRYVPIILLTALGGYDDLVRGIEAGAEEFLTKPVERLVLRTRVRAMLRVRERFGELRAATPDLDALLRARRERIADNAGLSARERQVLDLLLLGRNQEEIGLALQITPRTAKFHQARLLEKLGADSRVDLLRIFL